MRSAIKTVDDCLPANDAKTRIVFADNAIIKANIINDRKAVRRAS